jgi:arsenate reductase
MAEAYLRFFSKGQMEVFSAGLSPKGVHPKATQVMKEDGLDIGHHQSESIETYMDQSFDVILTVCDHAHEVCPIFPGGKTYVHHSFPDPAHAEGTEEEILNTFRSVRDQIKGFSAAFVCSFLA